MRLVRGGELFEHAAEPLSEDRAKFYAVQIALALGYLHKEKIVHRDLKLENILVEEDGYLCLADYGISKKIETVLLSDSTKVSGI